MQDYNTSLFDTNWDDYSWHNDVATFSVCLEEGEEPEDDQYAVVTTCYEPIEITLGYDELKAKYFQELLFWQRAECK